jgi:chromate reductase, NAD(P)H dehydrogenase (quinone)
MDLMLVTGSTRPRSTTTAVLHTVRSLTPPGSLADLWDGLLEVPAFVPDEEPPPPVVALRARIAAADAVLFCTPEYAGTLPGSLKNALDWTVGGGELYEKPVAWINAANPGRGGGAVETLRLVLGYVGAKIVDQACLTVPVGREAVGADGIIHDPQVRAALEPVWAALGSPAPGSAL